MIKHLLFYCAETTLITIMVLLGMLLAVSALKRVGVSIRPRWTMTIAGLWIAIACIDAVMSESIGPEFTLHYYFGIWTAVGGGVLWLVVGLRQGAISLKGRLTRQRKHS
jgi:peptidoglycan/LPS O-acetylase OafA/YrhL